MADLQGRGAGLAGELDVGAEGVVAAAEHLQDHRRRGAGFIGVGAGSQVQGVELGDTALLHRLLGREGTQGDHILVRLEHGTFGYP